MPREPDAPAPAPSAEARRLIDALAWQTQDEKAALSAYVAGLEAELARLRAAETVKTVVAVQAEPERAPAVVRVVAAQRGRAAEGGDGGR